MADAQEYLGRCIRRNESTAYFLVTHQRGLKDEFNLISDPARIFPKKGEVELHGIEALKMPLDAERIFTVKSNKQFRASSANMIAAMRNIILYKDWKNVANEFIARKIFFNRIEEFTPGNWVIRFENDNLVRLELFDNGSGKANFVESSFAELPIFKFNPDNLVKKVDEPAIIYYALDKTSPINYVNWQGDKQYIKTILDSCKNIIIEQNEGVNVTTILGLLDKITSSPDGSLSMIGSLDRKIAIDIVRTKDILRTLRLDYNLLTHVIKLLRGEPEYEELRTKALEIDREETRQFLTESLAKEIRAQKIAEVEADVAKIISEAETKSIKIQEDAEAKSNKIINDINKQAKELESNLLEEIHARLRSHEEEEMLKLSQRIEGERANIDLSIEEANLRQERLHAEELKMKTEIARIQADIDAEMANKQILLNEISQLSTNIDNLKTRQIKNQFSPYSLKWKSQLTVIKPDEWRDKLMKTGILTQEGNLLASKFAALILSGELPIIVGERANDFINFCAALLCGGRRVTMPCDPTIITIDDLWTRTGSAQPTILGQTVSELMSSGEFLPTLAVISNPLSSASRHWLQPLAELTQARAFYKNLLFCLSAQDTDGDALGELKGIPFIQVDNAFNKSSPTTAIIELGPGSTFFSYLEVEELRDTIRDAQDISRLNPITIQHAERISRFLAYARQIMTEEKAFSIAESLLADFQTSINQGH